MSTHRFHPIYTIIENSVSPAIEEPAKIKREIKTPRLPDEILRMIFAYLPTTAKSGDLARVAQVNKEWLAAARWW